MKISQAGAPVLPVFPPYVAIQISANSKSRDSRAVLCVKRQTVFSISVSPERDDFYRRYQQFGEPGKQEGVYRQACPIIPFQYKDSAFAEARFRIRKRNGRAVGINLPVPGRKSVKKRLQSYNL